MFAPLWPTRTARQGQGELAGPAAQVDRDIAVAQPEQIGQDVDHGTGIAVPVPVVELDELTTETQVHAVTMPAGRTRGTRFSSRREQVPVTAPTS